MKLNNGLEIPSLGFGTYLSKNEEVKAAVLAALEAGYRHIDTAMIYENEEGVGEAIAESGVPREEIFVTTKLWNEDIRNGNAEEALKLSLKKLQLDYVDLYLIHWPAKGYVKAWDQMIELQKQGLIKSIGVSNFNPHHLEDLAPSGVVPAVNQIECHPKLQQNELLANCNERDIVVQAWGPLMQAKLFEDETLKAIGAQYGKSTAQVMLRWHLQRGVNALPKSVTPSRIKANYEIFDFELSADDMAKITAMNEDQRVGPDPETFDF
ncbi:aldo/keto reductase [Flammeovirga yaeyamensis]|uniref:Aldo/keto reductase n=1 Tax=Flammeovirga yaeyamensis TaxID=367791 RepID=A0AAX1NCP5_9BACT|nr:aldo/keto reductase [Flammeovirga yaeyamensis]MBB3696762.1 2,5-diketo-D-gluconate reductase A [Flammeovirga yaeyamensis]NMF33429.1 aldo/keto reductase [Flammeovirga yaeyamensis]QWG05296.1 aldo/keto reductase [Flammeovirga yaeyamensis]